MSPSATPGCAVEERTIKGELISLDEALSALESSVETIISKLGVVASERRAEGKSPAVSNPVVQERIAEVIELRLRVRALLSLLADVTNEIDRIC